ncbi:terminase [Rhodococcus phage Shagrat]|nr:terminase [Rhodococcus phage Shagrat]
MSAPILIGSQEPKIIHRPTGLDLSGIGEEVIDLAELAGLVLDPWQADFIAEACRTREEKYYNKYTKRYENKWAAFEIGLVVARQNGKGSILEARELAGLFLFGERLIIHSAHQFDTSQEAFERLLMLIEETPDLSREVARVSRSHGEEGITLKTGQRIRFRTRTKGGGRGFTGDCVILDEAMYLEDAQVGALMPTMAARSIQGNPQIWYMGSAGTKDSKAFGRVRARAIKGNEPGLFFEEFSVEVCDILCPDDCDEHIKRGSDEAILLTNPGVGIRIDIDHCRKERRSMDEEQFNRERLSIGDWPVEGEAWKIVDEESWKRREDPHSVIDGKPVLALHVSPDRTWSAIMACGATPDGQTQVEITGKDGVLDYRQGVSWTVDRVVEICKNQRCPFLVIDPGGQAGGLIEEIEKKLKGSSTKILTPNSREYAQACGEWFSAVKPRRGNPATLVHIGQPGLTSAMGCVDKKALSNLWVWDYVNSSSDITPLVAGTLALWGFKKNMHKAVSAPWAAWR